MKNLWVLKYNYYLFFMLLPSSQFFEPPPNWKCSVAYAWMWNALISRRCGWLWVFIVTTPSTQIHTLTPSPSGSKNFRFMVVHFTHKPHFFYFFVGKNSCLYLKSKICKTILTRFSGKRHSISDKNCQPPNNDHFVALLCTLFSADKCTRDKKDAC